MNFAKTMEKTEPAIKENPVMREIKRALDEDIPPERAMLAARIPSGRI